MYNINEANELLDAIEILAEKSAKNNAVIYSGIVTEISTSVCTMKINGNTYSNIVYYGGTPIVGNAYRVFVPFGNMSQAFTLIFADTSPGESGVQSVNGIELGLKSTEHGGYLDFHYEGDESDYTTRLIEQEKGVLTLIGEWANPTKRKNFDQTGVIATTYPTSAGIYHLIGTNIFSNLIPGSNYGTLVIFRSTYGMHLYLDAYNNLYYGCGGNDSGITEPTTWQLVDGIVEEGTSGMWTYRKYASGRLECFGTKTYTGNASSPWGSMYVLSCTAEDYPVAFVDYPNIQREPVLNNEAGCWIASYGTGSKTNCGTFALVRPTSMAVNVSVKFFATGHWK